MTLTKALSVTKGIFHNADLTEIFMACEVDLMSDVLAFTQAGMPIMAGLTTPKSYALLKGLAMWLTPLTADSWPGKFPDKGMNSRL